jgi:competence protein ComEA
LAWLERNQFLVLGLAGLFLLAALLVRDITRTHGTPALVLNDPSDTRSVVMVHVAGAVAAPGLYELVSGARIQDAMVAAGGALPDADLDAINLARRVRDGEKVTVPAGTSPGAKSEVAGAVATLAPGQRLDINSATVEQLDQLPGIGEAYSRAIVDGRLVDGPYGAIEDLTARRVIPAATFEQIRDLVTVTAP